MFSKLNRKGFSHHLLFPVIAVLAVGVIGVVMLQMSNAASCPTIGYKSTYKTCVKEAQRLLNKRGARLTVDGVFLNGTLSAVRSFQANYNLCVDGNIGSKTWASLKTGKRGDGCKGKTTDPEINSAKRICNANGGTWQSTGKCKYPPSYFTSKTSCINAGYKWSATLNTSMKDVSACTR